MALSLMSVKKMNRKKQKLSQNCLALLFKIVVHSHYIIALEMVEQGNLEFLLSVAFIYLR